MWMGVKSCLQYWTCPCFCLPKQYTVCIYGVFCYLFFCRVHHFIIVHLEIQDLFYKRYMNMSVEIQSFICLWTSGNEVYHEEKWPEFSRWSAPTRRDRRTNKRMYSYSFFGANNNKVSKFRTSNCTEETGDWTLMHSTARSFNHISVSLGNIWGFYLWSMLLPHESAETCNKY